MRYDAFNQYEDLLQGDQWLGGSFCWTVVGPFQAPVTETEIMTRLSAGAVPEIREINVREGGGLFFHPIDIFFVFQSGQYFNIINVGSQPAHYQEHCHWLSKGTHLRSVTWQINGYDRFTCAVDGEIALDLPEGFCRELSSGNNPEAFSEELALLYRTPEDEVIRQRAAAMTILGERSGFVLNHEWLHSKQVAVLVDQPIPEGAKPYSVSAWMDPDLHSVVESAPLTSRRSALLELVERLTDRFELEWSSVRIALDAISRGEGVGAELRRSLMDETLRLAYFWQESSVDTLADSPLWLRWQAGIAVRLALVSAAQNASNLEALYSARNALGEDWPETRQCLLGLIQNPPSEPAEG